MSPSSVAFYRDALGFKRGRWRCRARRSCRRRVRPTTTTSACSRSARRPRASAAGRGTVGLYHLAWEVDTLDELAPPGRRVVARAARSSGASDHSTTKSLYVKDPDGLEFELAWVVPGGAASTRRSSRRDRRSSRSTCPARSPASAATPAAAWACPCDLGCALSSWPGWRRRAWRSRGTTRRTARPSSAWPRRLPCSRCCCASAARAAGGARRRRGGGLRLADGLGRCSSPAAWCWPAT